MKRAATPLIPPIRCPAVIGRVLLFTGGLCLAFLLRVHGSGDIPDGRFTGNDAYFYYWQAHLISENGHLPERDMHRWLPLGRDLGQTLNLYGYVLAYTHKALTVLLPTLSLYHVTFYAPVFFFCLGGAVLCLFLYYTHGTLFSSSVGIILTTLPGTIDRSTAGFGDRDAWCFMLGLLSVTAYLTSLKAHKKKRRLFWTLASGCVVFLGGLSWEGFGVFISIIICVELWRFLTSETEDGLAHYLLWMLTFVPTLWIASPAYRNGYGFAEHLFAFFLVPPVVLFGIRTLRSLLLSNIEKLRPYARSLALGITLTSTAVALGYVLIQRHTFADTTVPFSQNPLMLSVEELQSPDLFFWLSRYGSIALFGSFGIILMHLQWLKKYSKALAMVPTLFISTILFREPLEKTIGNPELGHLLFFTACLLYLITFLFIAATRKKPIENENVTVAFLACFCIWAALTRDARRYDVFIGIALAYFTTQMVIHIAENISENINWKQETLKKGIAVLTLALLIFFKPLGGHATRALYASTRLTPAFPRENALVNTIRWMKNNLNSTAVVAANWSYGSTLNVLGGVKTIIDQDHYIQNWIHLYHKYIYKATADQDSLEFLKTHSATHLMLTQTEPKHIYTHKAFREVFVPVYPTENFENARVKIWEIHYPPDIQPDPKYLRTGIPEIDAQLPEH